MKHTQGNWKIRKIDDDEFGFEIGLSVKDKDAIACVFNLYKSDEEAEDNAKLIAAAPELLEACLAIYYDAIHHQHRHNSKMFPKRKEAIDKLESAIKKATE